MRMTTLWVLLIALALPLACSRAQETADDAASAVADVAADAQQATADVAAAAGAAASDLIDDPVAKCNELAAEGAWSEALDACTKAHQAEPDNMAIEHALQQAQAAAAE
jgi:hypothetical protein